MRRRRRRSRARCGAGRGVGQWRLLTCMHPGAVAAAVPLLTTSPTSHPRLCSARARHLQAKGAGQAEKKRSKKADKKARARAEAEAAGAQQARPDHEVEQRRLEEQREGLARLMAQMEEDEAAAAAARAADSAATAAAAAPPKPREQVLAFSAVSSQQPLKGSPDEGEEDVFSTPLSSPLVAELAADSPAPRSPRQPALGPRGAAGQQEQAAQQAAAAQQDGEGAGRKRRSKGAAAAPLEPQPEQQEPLQRQESELPAAAEDDGWEQAPTAGRRRGGKAAARPGSAAGGAAAQRYQRIVSWSGDWLCVCGTVNEPRERCPKCQAECPCRCGAGRQKQAGPWRCVQRPDPLTCPPLPPAGTTASTAAATATGLRRAACKFPHPPFELPLGLRPATMRVSSSRTGLKVEVLQRQPAAHRVPRTRHPAARGQPGGRKGRRSAAGPRRAAAPRRRAGVKTPQKAPEGPGRGHAAPGAAPAQQQAAKRAAPSAAPATSAAAAAAAAGPVGSDAAWRAAAQTGDTTTQAAAAAGEHAAAARQPPAAAEEDDVLAELLGIMGVSAGDEVPLEQPDSAPGGWGAPVPAPSTWAQLAGTGGEAEAAAGVPAWPAIGESEEDAELAAAIKASLEDASAAATHLHRAAVEGLGAAGPAGGGWRGPGPGGAAPTRRASTTASSTSSCSACGAAPTSVTWCVARAGVRGWLGGAVPPNGLRSRHGETCPLSPPLLPARRWPAGTPRLWPATPCWPALHALFAQFAEQEEQRRAGEGGSLAAVDPTPLREALAALPGQQFGLG